MTAGNASAATANGSTKATRRPTKSKPSVLFDAPGPRARLRNNVMTLVAVVILLCVEYLIL